MPRLLLYLTAVLHFSTCGSTDLCNGDYQCTLCTVTGPTLIDIHGRINSIQDRCAYSLMNTMSIPDIQVHATFQERRRQDVSFLDRVILSLDDPGVHINLEQGGIVLLGSTPMTLNATAQLVHGVELSKDQTGVTAKMSHLNYTMTVFFDGYTAQIHIKGPSGQAATVGGLCGNSSTSFADLRLSAYSESGCEEEYEDTGNITAHYNMTERCELINKEDFTACHSIIAPEPYSTACLITLSTYPDVDGLYCQFVQAYTRACNLHINDNLDGWRSKTNCYPRAFCQDRFCSTHEFCGEDSNGNGTRCHCRAIFASPYISEDALGDDMVCIGTSRLVTLVGCLLEEKGISYTDVHLYDKSCVGEMDNVTHMVTLSFDTKTNPCGAMIRMNDNSDVINKNAVMLETTSEEMIDLTCPFVYPDFTIDFSVNIKVKSGSSSSTSVAYVTTGVWNYTLTMNAYTNADRTQAVKLDTQLHLNQMIWFELKAYGLDEKKVSLVTNSCFATSEPSPDADLTYNIINNGCANPSDGTVTMSGNGQGTSNYFAFGMFQFAGKTGDVYLHCRLNVCLNDDNNTCIPSCTNHARKRRSMVSKYKDETPAIIIMAWSS
ncbi:alpha-tectorin-like [Anoplopoma fimbria]|uniref:alpha-tectorin-like n=1 Tax=Anoplopoma fimbria TaxID=229290 RepID=UPI0023ED2C27|nr:alpha-tectorin-like [Anoplopoma fimbria]